VVVTLNYRLGALGSLALGDALAGGETTDSNLALRDQTAALEWVRENIAAFGGDPAQVTIFGESAGGMAVSTLLAMPAASGLFRGAIAQSGAAHNVHSAESAARVAETLLRTLGLGASEAAKLHDVPVAKLLQAQAQTLAELGRNLGLLAFAPAIDRDTLPRHPLAAVREGAARDVTVMAGTTRDETKLFTMGMTPPDLDETVLAKRLRSVLRGLRADEARAEAMIDTYKRARHGVLPTTPGELFDALETDRTFRIPAIRLAEAQRPHQPRTYKYFFTWCSPARRGALGACHALELPFVFGWTQTPLVRSLTGLSTAARRLSLSMQHAWGSFARVGDPSHEGLPSWPGYEPILRSTMLLAGAARVIDAPLEAERRLIDEW